MEVKLLEAKHPNRESERLYANLIAIDNQKHALLNTLQLFFEKERIDDWHKKHHSSKLLFLGSIRSGSSLVILSGDVGCGKTALASSIGTALAKLIDKRITVFETPSNIRGSGRVGELSNRITDAFEQVKSKTKSDQIGILVIDEADDLATDRDQNQAHHEDRAGLNVLIKQIDLLSRENVNLVVILITNRLKVLDPAVIRRATAIIEFERPDKTSRKLVFNKIFEGLELSDLDIDKLVSESENDTPYSFSDLIQKVAKQALYKAIELDRPFDKDIYLEVLKTVNPSPSINKSLKQKM